MSNMNSMEREQKKRQLKRRIIEPGSAPGGGRPRKEQEDSEEEIVRKAEWKTRMKHFRLVMFFAFLAVLIIFLAVRYVRGHQYTEYTVAWEKEIPASESSFTGYMKFGDNMLKYSKDGASYIDKSGNAVWSLSYQMKSPVCYINGNYAVLGDQQGNSIYICDTSGLQGEATTLLPILRVSVSAYGVAAALVEDSTSSYITFFKKDGSTLDWSIKTVMSKSGYLMDVSMSPEGTQVMLSDLYIQDSTLKNRIVFYNFSEFGKSYPDRLVGGFDEFGESLCPRVRFFDEDHACAVTDNQLAFFSLENVTSPELVKQIPVEEQIKSIAYSDSYVAVIVDAPSGEYDNRLDVYKSDGSPAFSREFTYLYQNMDIDGDFVILYNDNSCKIYDMSGRERFSGEFDFTVAKITRGSRFNSLIITGGDRIREIILK
ncbi:DUF5711 family protein [uncultured Clostridium sp.]|uniref:DUF5711 family protein n=1 Tax=uncultured Clostridium sp. TaxID=59620 RepID=UPI0025CFEE0E|nr:DUF5711 family protein [uncultured Clostridium sp.]